MREESRVFVFAGFIAVIVSAVCGVAYLLVRKRQHC